MIIYNCHTHMISTNHIPRKSMLHIIALIKKAERGTQLSNKVPHLTHRELVVQHLSFMRCLNGKLISKKSLSNRLLNPNQYLVIAKSTEKEILTFFKLCEKISICKN